MQDWLYIDSGVSLHKGSESYSVAVGITDP